MDRIDDAVTDDFVCHHTAAGVELHGAEEFLIVDGDMGAGHYRWGGTHDGEFMGMPATDRTVDTTSTTLMRMDGDRMAEMWVYGNNGEVMEQLGVERPN